MRLRPVSLVWSVLLLLWSSVACDRGTPLENLPPETSIFVEEINLTGQDRLNSVVTLYWTGEDRDGYVTGFEVSTDGQSWGFTTATDSTFRFDLPTGLDTVDVTLYVRAVDNAEARDPSPASLLVPLKNQPPVARFDTLVDYPDTVYSVWSTTWTVDDPDGFNTLDSTFVRVNDGPWRPLARSVSYLTFIPVDPASAGPQSLQVFEGPQLSGTAATLPGARVGDWNRVYVRARDIAGSFSAIDSTDAFFLRSKTSDLLLIDDHGNSDADQFWREGIAAIYGSQDRLVLSRNRPPFWDPTFALILNLYDKVIWYSDGAQNDGQINLEYASAGLQEFLNSGGKLFVSTKFPAEYNDEEYASRSTIFGFTPIQSLTYSEGQARIARDSLVRGTGALSGIAPLVSGSFITGVDPFVPKIPGDVILEADITPVGGWTGPSSVGAKGSFTNGETNQVFISVEIHQLNDDLAAMNALLDRILNQEFDW